MKTPGPTAIHGVTSNKVTGGHTPVGVRPLDDAEELREHHPRPAGLSHGVSPLTGAWDAYQDYQTRNGPTEGTAGTPFQDPQAWSIGDQLTSLGIGNQAPLLPTPPERLQAEFGSTMTSLTGAPPAGDLMENNNTQFATTFQQNTRRMQSFRRPQNQETRTTLVSTWNTILGNRPPGAPFPPYGNLQMGAPPETRMPTAMDQEGVHQHSSNARILTEVGTLLRRVR